MRYSCKSVKLIRKSSTDNLLLIYELHKNDRRRFVTPAIMAAVGRNRPQRPLSSAYRVRQQKLCHEAGSRKSRLAAACRIERRIAGMTPVVEYGARRLRITSHYCEVGVRDGVHDQSMAWPRDWLYCS